MAKKNKLWWLYLFMPLFLALVCAAAVYFDLITYDQLKEILNSNTYNR